MPAASTVGALPDSIIRTVIDDRSIAAYRHFADAVGVGNLSDIG